MGPSGRDPWLAFNEARRLASFTQCAIRCSDDRTPFFVLPSNDGCCRLFCGKLFLGSCTLASGVESSYKGGNAPHVLHPTGLLFLLSCPTGRGGQECAAMV